MFILASSSPRRKELLSTIIQDFVIVKPEVDEDALKESVSPRELALEESKLKASWVHERYPNEEILASDTVVLLNGVPYGKPLNKEDAFRMLKEESGNVQEVITAYTYISKDAFIARSVTSQVYFNELTDEEINDYIERFSPLDKAGAYGIQDNFPLIAKIKGSFSSVMGLPVEDLIENVFSQRK